MEENKTKKSTSKRTKKQENTFEESVNELEEIVQKLEKGELPLEESIEYFQRGIELSRDCSKKLDEIEKKITILVESGNGNIIEENFDVERKNEI